MKNLKLIALSTAMAVCAGMIVAPVMAAAPVGVGKITIKEGYTPSWADVKITNQGYISTYGINTVDLEINLKDGVLGVQDGILGFKGTGGTDAYTAYFGLDLGLVAGTDMWTNVVSDVPVGIAGNYPNGRTLEQVQTSLVALMNQHYNNPYLFNLPRAFWPAIVEIHYNTGSGFARVPGAYSGQNTAGDLLLAALSAKNVSKTLEELAYGTDYILIMGGTDLKPDFSYVLAGATNEFSAVGKGSATAAGTNWYKINYDLVFGITALDKNKNEIYFPTLQDAIDAGWTDIVVNTAVEIEAGETLTIPAGTDITILENASITVEEGADFVNKGTIEGDGEIETANPVIITGNATVVGETTERWVKILEDGMGNDAVVELAKNNDKFGDFVDKLPADSIFLTMNDESSCDTPGCAVTVTLSGVTAGARHHLYHYEDDGTVSFVDSFDADEKGDIEIKIERFSGNILTTELINLGGTGLPATGASSANDQSAVGADTAILMAMAVGLVAAVLCGRVLPRLKQRKV